MAQIEDSGAPLGVRQILTRRLSKLSPTANDVLRVAAVAGNEFRAAEIGGALGRDRDEVIPALEEGAASGLIRDTGQRPVRYRFSHALVRQALYQKISPLRRAQLHWR